MIDSHRKLVLAALLAAAAFAQAAPALADEKVEARKHFEAGLDLMKTEDFAGAAVAFESSVRLYPTKTSLFNLAHCYKALQRYGDSLETIQRLEAEFGGNLGAELEAEVAQLRRTLENLVGRLEVKAAPAGATIRVDGRDVGQSPLARPLVLGPGEHQVEVSLDGWIPEKRTVRVEPRGKAEVSLELKRAAAASPGPEITPEPGPEADTTTEETVDLPTPPAEEPAPPGHGPLWTGGWVVAGIGAAVMIAGAATGGLALSAGNELESDYPDGVPRSDEDKVERMDSLAVATNVLLGVGGAAVVAGVVMLILDDGPAERDVALLPAAGPSFAGAALTGRF